LQPAEEQGYRSEVSIDRFSIECTSKRHKTGNYKGISIFIKFIECDSLTPTREDLLELKLVRRLRSFLCVVLYAGRVACCSLVSHRQSYGLTDGRQTVTLCFPL